ncbi:MAG: RNA polymerase sigma factor [Acidobacteriota bacterium]|nr:RNA polymerase sigma factor [Acidobacteriota bacterium]
MTSAKALEFGAAAWSDNRVGETAETKLILDLYDQEQVSLRRYVLYLGVDRATAEETVQESFLRLHQHLLAGGDRTNLRAWLYRVTHNLARNAQSSARSSRTGALEDLMPAAQPATPAASAEEELLDLEQKELLRQAFSRLSPAQRNCLVLRSQGLKYREIAEALDLSTSTVAENVQRGLEKLKEIV